MDTIKKYMKEYEVPLLTGVSSVALGWAAKKVLRKDVVGVSSLKSAGETFVLVSIAGVLAQEMKNKNIM